MLDLSRLLDRRREHWVLAGMLMVLHLALRADFGSALSASLMTAHLGLFFLWQPIWQQDQRLDIWSTVLIIVFAIVFVAVLDWWLIFGWLIVLIGIVAGRSFSTRQERIAYMLTLAFLVSELLIECVPSLFTVPTLNVAVLNSFRVGLTGIPFLLLFLPTSKVAQRRTFPVDFFRGVTFSLMTALLAISSVLITHQREIDYPLALIASLIALGSFLFVIGWFITPGSGGGLASLWEKSVLNIGTPFEGWLSDLARLASQRQRPDEFVEAAVEELIEIPWISGGRWRANDVSGFVGEQAAYDTRVSTEQIEITLYTARPIGPALLIHSRLLIQVLSHFYTAKLREQEQAQQAHLKAVYETGARLTHDIKNLLQSLQTITAAVPAGESGESSERIRQRQELLERQLPRISQRLQLTLDKLQRPSGEQSEFIDAGRWWQDLLARYEGQGFEFNESLDDPGAQVPLDCFNSAVENLLDNAQNKAKLEPAIAVRVDLRSVDGAVCLTVSDDGSAIESTTAARILNEPVPSSNGLGIGLYQVARQAELNGFHLSLSENRSGRVVFKLEPKRTAGNGA